MAGSRTQNSMGREIRGMLNPGAPEFIPQTYQSYFPNIITTHHQYNYHYSSLYFHTLSSSPSNSQASFILPPPPSPPPTYFPISVPAVEAEDPIRHQRDQTSVLPTDLRHHQDQNRRRNDRRPRYLRRRGSGLLGRRRRVNLRENLGERNINCDSQRGPEMEVFPGLMRGGNDATTVMIRNIPSKYTRQMLLDFLDDHCMLQNQLRLVEDKAAGEDDQQPIISAFDFLYLPMDFRTELNKGYAFVNFTSPQAASKFSEATNNQTWVYFHSSKIRKIARARLQGSEELIRHFQSMAFPCGTEEFLPVWFSPPRDGANKELVTQTTVGKLVGKNKKLPKNQQQVLPG